MFDGNRLEKAGDGKYRLPDGSYFDENEILRAPGGDPMPDGMYVDGDGNVLMYEGDSMSRLIVD